MTARRRNTKSKRTTKRRVRTTLKTSAPKAWFWRLLFFVAFVGIFVWLALSLGTSLLTQVLSGVEQTTIVSIANASRTNSLVAVLETDNSQSKVYSLEGIDFSTTKLLVQRDLQTRENDLSSQTSLQRSLWLDAISSVSRFDFAEARLLLAVWEVLRKRGLIAMTTAEDLIRAVSPLERLGSSCPIGVANTSAISGAASTFANMLVSQGGLVLRITNYDAEIEKPTVLVDEGLQSECGESAQLIHRSLPNSAILSFSSDLYSTYRVGVLVLLDAATAELLTSQSISE